MSSLPVDSSLPDWAVRRADAALKIGQSVPEIERGLVAKGLSAALATAVVTAVLEGRVRAIQEPLERSERLRTAHRTASAVAACIGVGLAYGFGGGESAFKILRWLLVPLACIWWAELAEPSIPPRLIRWVAWLLLILFAGLPVVLLWF
jgi:hypothetical protein